MKSFAISLLALTAIIQFGAVIELPNRDGDAHLVKKEQIPKIVWRRTVNGWENMNDWETSQSKADADAGSGYEANTAILKYHPAAVASLVMVISLLPFGFPARNPNFVGQGSASRNSRSGLAFASESN